ncbi:hypothetical protein RHMOL_Rhmol13G0170500 [Rhododendron molle]|uniref:Uncharacterized protein n=1 Tax=Rhododendron molle TaxID=49168 RepID=A0ACC0L7X6_RHOML|nr:hypothetical protein RHMOL_Rhmol13G0170500 [Rhododendron molle]
MSPCPDTAIRRPLVVSVFHRKEVKKQVNSVARKKGNGNGGNKSGEKTWDRPLRDDRDHLAITTNFKEPIFRILRECGRMVRFQWLTVKLGTADGCKPDRRVFCIFYNEQGHYTTACQPYKLYLEELVQQGKMEQWIDRTKSPVVGVSARD